MTCLIFPSVSQLAIIGKTTAFEYENKESRESNNHTERLNWSSFKDAYLQKSNTIQQP